MSLITTLVPAYKHEYLAELFAGLRSQTLRDFRVIVADDSPDGLITRQLREGRFDPLIQDLNVTVVPGGGGLWKNHQRALDAWAGSSPLVHLLMDDDVIYPDFYREHAALHAGRQLSASVSLRWLTRPDGGPFGTLPLPEFVTQSPQRVIEIEPARLFASTVATSDNWLGELSNMLLSAEAARRFPKPPTEGVSYFGLPDIGLLLNAADVGPVMLLRDHLGGFRQHAAQSTSGTQSVALKIAHLAWVAFALKAHHEGRLDADQTMHGIARATQRCMHAYRDDALLGEYFEIAREHLRDLETFEPLFTGFWQSLISSHADTRPERPAGAPAPRRAEAPKVTLRQPQPGDRLVVLDNFFPNLLTGFRVAEYNAYLEAFPAATVLSTLPDFDAHYAAYAKLYPQHAGRVQRFAPEKLAGCGLAYINFIDNVDTFLPHLKKAGLPFVMTLYPGGGFGIGYAISDAKLRRALSSPLLQGVITTQPITAEYLGEFAQERGLPAPATHAIPGVVANPIYFDEAQTTHGAYFGEGKENLDICFVAEKYVERGANKGYPEFVSAMHALRELRRVRIHVVGSFEPGDVDVSALGGQIRFHGRLETSQLRSFFREMDLSIGLAIPNVMHPGNFDGFPLGCTVESSLCGVAVMASDVLGQNPGYVDGESMLFVQPNAGSLTGKLAELLSSPTRLGQIGRAGQAVTRRLYAPQAQIAPRIAVLEGCAGRLGLALR